MRVGFVACSSVKLGQAAPAFDLYQGQLFKLARALVEQRCERWYILSARWGLVEPSRVIEPYDQALATMLPWERREWAQGTRAEILGAVAPGDELLVLAGSAYRAAFEGIPHFAPLQGLGIGHQKQLLGRLLRGA